MHAYFVGNFKISQQLNLSLKMSYFINQRKIQKDSSGTCSFPYFIEIVEHDMKNYEAKVHVII